MPRVSERVQSALRAARRLWLSVAPRPAERGFAELRRRFYSQYWQEAAEAAGVTLTGLGEGFVEARRGKSWTLIREDKIALDDHLRVRFVGHKTLLARLLGPHGFVTPRSLSFRLEEIDNAERFLSGVSGSAVIKPDGVATGRFATQGPGAGRGVTCGIRTISELREAARRASLFGANIIVEEQMEGASYRLLYLDGRFIDAIRRDAPRLFGDGLSTVRELVRRENAERRHAWPPLALHPVTWDLDCRLTLARQGLSPGSVVRAQTAITIKTACNQNAAYDNHVARDLIHPALAALGGKLVREFGLRVAGLDVMTTDPVLPPRPGSVRFNEINATPGLHHHWLVAEEARRAPIGALVLEAALGGQAVSAALAGAKTRLTDAHR